MTYLITRKVLRVPAPEGVAIKKVLTVGVEERRDLKMEYTKFDRRRAPYRRALAAIEDMGFSFYDYIHHNPPFAGHLNIARYLTLFETYRHTLGIAGHIAEVGV